MLGGNLWSGLEGSHNIAVCERPFNMGKTRGIVFIRIEDAVQVCVGVEGRGRGCVCREGDVCTGVCECVYL